MLLSADFTERQIVFFGRGGIGRIASEEVVLHLIITGALRVVVNGWMDGWITPPIAF